jgi:hypothetical protein
VSRDEDRRLQWLHEINDAEGSKDVARWGVLEPNRAPVRIDRCQCPGIPGRSLTLVSACYKTGSAAQYAGMPSSAGVAIIVSLFAAAFAKKTWKDVDTLQVGVKVRHLLNSSSLHNISLQLYLYEDYCEQHVLIFCLLPILSQSDLQYKPEECIRKTRPSDEVEVHYKVSSSSHHPLLVPGVPCHGRKVQHLDV